MPIVQPSVADSHGSTSGVSKGVTRGNPLNIYALVGGVGCFSLSHISLQQYINYMNTQSPLAVPATFADPWTSLCTRCGGGSLMEKEVCSISWFFKGFQKE